MFGFCRLGATVLDELVTRWEAAELPLVRDTYHRAILGILADTGEIPEELERFVNLTNLLSPTRDYAVYSHTLRDYRRALSAMNRERAVELVLRDARELDNPRWPRVFAALPTLMEPEILAALFEGLAAGRPTKHNDQDWAGDLRSLWYENQELLAPHFGGLLAARKDPDTHNWVRQIVHDKYDEILAASGAESAADASKAAKLKRLADAYFETSPDAPGATVFILERQDEAPDGESLNRISGRPFGVDPQSWPGKNGDADLPMEHMFTLDFETLPGMKDRFATEVRGVSLFVYSPGSNTAWTPDNADAAVLFVTEDNVDEFSGELPAGYEAATAFAVETVVIPADVFTVSYDGPEDLRVIKNTLYNCNAWMGPAPIWLQSEEHFGEFLLQFDEGFASLNLGDCGIMYVFADTAFWQCH